jgi:hypothetical protein
MTHSVKLLLLLSVIHNMARKQLLVELDYSLNELKKSRVEKTCRVSPCR